MDSDIDLSGCPKDIFSLLRSGLDEHPGFEKTGPSLEIEDLPDEYPLKKKVIEWEGGRFWKNRLDDKWWIADIDTHMCMHRAGTGWGGYGPSLRSDRPYIVRHILWYITPETVTEEDIYYAIHATSGKTTKRRKKR